MEWLIALAVLALIVRVVFFFIYPELDNALSGYDKETTENDHEHFDKQDGYDIPYQTIQGGTSAGGIAFNNTSNNYGIMQDNFKS